MSPDAPAPRVLPNTIWHDPALTPAEAQRDTDLMEAVLAAYPDQAAWWIWGDCHASTTLRAVIEWGNQ